MATMRKGFVLLVVVVFLLGDIASGGRFNRRWQEELPVPSAETKLPPQRPSVQKLVPVQRTPLQRPLPSQKFEPFQRIAPLQKMVVQKSAPAISYHVRYKHHATLRPTCCTCCPPRQAVLQVNDPCCQLINVNVTIPGCCKSIPLMTTGRDIFKRCSYTYEWPCGYKVHVAFRAKGDIVVHSWGRLK